ncbi:MAG: polyprenyl synthetase family protein [Anaerolineae bacterium]
MYTPSPARLPESLNLEPILSSLDALDAVLQDVSAVGFPLVADVVRAAFASGGKRLRPSVALLTGQIVHAPKDTTLALAAAVETLHVASLVHDDLIDQSLIRRGHPTLNAVLSAETTVLAGDYLFARAAAFAADTLNPRVVQAFSECLMDMCAGELGQLAQRRVVPPSRDDYLRRIHSKTAVLFATASSAAGVLGGASEQEIALLRQYGENVGVAFQISDDILDFAGDPDVLGKPIGADIRRGTVTLPVLYAADIADLPLAQALAGEQWAIETVIEAVVTSDALDLARADAERYAAAAVSCLSWFSAGSARQTLEALADFSVRRVA